MKILVEVAINSLLEEMKKGLPSPWSSCLFGYNGRSAVGRCFNCFFEILVLLLSWLCLGLWILFITLLMREFINKPLKIVVEIEVIQVSLFRICCE